MIEFNEKQIFIVTGASSGLGEGTALLLNSLGATVIGIARDENRLKQMKTKCKYPENMYLEIRDLTKNIEDLPNYIKWLRCKYGKFASKDSEIRSYRAVKQAKSKVINKKIKAQKKELTKLLSDPTLTDEEYAIKTEEIRKNMANLYSQREQNKKDYMKTKKGIKKGE